MVILLHHCFVFTASERVHFWLKPSGRTLSFSLWDFSCALYLIHRMGKGIAGDTGGGGDRGVSLMWQLWKHDNSGLTWKIMSSTYSGVLFKKYVRVWSSMDSGTPVKYIGFAGLERRLIIPVLWFLIHES